jgi:acyl carrier protein
MIVSDSMNANVIKEKLRAAICGDVLRDPTLELSDTEPLITSGLVDSQSIVQIAVFIEDTFRVTIPDTDLTTENMDTIAKIAALVKAGMQET